MLKIINKEELEKQAEEGGRNIERRRQLGPEPESALIWFPAILAAGLPVPRTEMILFNHESLWPVLDGKEAQGFPMEQLKRSCLDIGYPVFLRTDLSSAKHDGPISYRAKSEEDLWRCVVRTFEDNAIKDIACFTRAFMVREFLDLPAPFTAFRGHPIAREWRLFASQSQVVCEHFYWPEEAFEGGWASVKEWREMLKGLSSPPPELNELREMALQATQAIGQGEWSVDFAQDRAGKWWLIDMAVARKSWHPDHEG